MTEAITAILTAKGFDPSRRGIVMALHGRAGGSFDWVSVSMTELGKLLYTLGDSLIDDELETRLPSVKEQANGAWKKFNAEQKKLGCTLIEYQEGEQKWTPEGEINIPSKFRLATLYNLVAATIDEFPKQVKQAKTQAARLGKPTLRRFQDTDESKSSRREYLTINDAVGFVLDAAVGRGLSKKGRDTVASLHRTLPATMKAYQPVKRARETIGRKIPGLRSNDPERLKKSAGARLGLLFNQDLPRCGKQLISREAITKDGEIIEAGQQCDGYFDYHYTDYTIPAAQAALERARNHLEWKFGDGHTKQAILRAACEWAFDEMIPDCLTPEAGEKDPNQLDCDEYAEMAEKRLLREAKAYGEKIANEYNDPERAQSFMRYISRKIGEEAGSYHRIAYKRKNPLAPLLGITPPPAMPNAPESHTTESQEAFTFDSEPLDQVEWPEEIALALGEDSDSPLEREGGCDSTLGANARPETEPRTGAEPPEIVAVEIEGERAKNAPPALDNFHEDKNLVGNIFFETPPQLISNFRWVWVMRYVINLGWAIIPNHYKTESGACSCGHSECRPGGKREKSIGKHPATPNGIDGWSKDLATLAAYWLKEPHYNIGIATGEPSGVDVADFDGEPGAALIKEWESKGWIDDDGLQANTPTAPGRHVFIEHIPGLKNGVKPIPGLDIRTTRGQVIVEGSETLNGFYRWRGERGSAAAALNPSPELTAYLLRVAAKEDSKPTGGAMKKAKVFSIAGGPVAANGRHMPDYQRCVAGAPRKADGITPDWSIADSKYVTWALTHGFSDDEAARMLAGVSDLTRKSDPAFYVWETVNEVKAYLLSVGKLS